MCPWKICDENFKASCENKEGEEQRLVSLTDGATCSKNGSEIQWEEKVGPQVVPYGRYPSQEPQLWVECWIQLRSQHGTDRKEGLNI